LAIAAAGGFSNNGPGSSRSVVVDTAHETGELGKINQVLSFNVHGNPEFVLTLSTGSDIDNALLAGFGINSEELVGFKGQTPVLDGDRLLFSFHTEGLSGNFYIVTDDNQDLVLGIKQSKGCTYANGGSFGKHRCHSSR
jgi:hypothetical protein